MTEAEYKERLSSYFKLKDDKVKALAEEFKGICTYISGLYDVADGFIQLNDYIKSLEGEWVASGLKRDRLFYLALPPSQFGSVATFLKKEVYSGLEGTSRIIIEKPFGHDLESSRELQNEIGPVWSEEEIYRIDHYLGKEMVKNIPVLRFGNQFLKNSWNKESIASIKISFKEPFGTEGRGGYFDEIGIIRDVLQNHLLQVLCLLTMAKPASFAPEDVRDEKVKVLKSIAPIDLTKMVLGQYDKSEDGTKPSYLDDKTVPEGSRAVTFAAFQVDIKNEQWEGVPIILTAGKALDEGKVEIRIQFRENTDKLFDAIEPSELIIRVQPKEAIFFKINTRTPGLVNGKTSVNILDLEYSSRYPDAHIPEAYEALILDALKGDHANFVRDDELDVSWQIFTPLLHHIENKSSNINLETYPYGSTGPASLKDFLAKRGHSIDSTISKGNL